MKSVISFSGPRGSGKTTAAQYLRQRYGFTILSSRSLLSSVLNSNDIEASLPNLQDLGAKVISVVGPAGFVALMLEFVPPGSYVLDAVRYADAIDYLKHRFGSQYCHIHLTTPERLRHSRMRLRDGPSLTSADYGQSEKASTELGGPELEKKADFLLKNEGTKEELYLEIDRAVKS